MCLPFGVALNKNANLYVAEYGNSRVLEFNVSLAIPAKPNVIAKHVFGQHDNLTTNVCSDGNGADPAVGPAGLCRPESVAADSKGNIYIADSGNWRVLEYNQPFGSSNSCKKPSPDASGCSGDRVADLVFGQSPTAFLPGPMDFTDHNCNGTLGEQSAFRTCLVTDVAVDKSDNLFIVDQTNNRALEFLGRRIQLRARIGLSSKSPS